MNTVMRSPGKQCKQRSALGDSGSTPMTTKNPAIPQPPTQLSSFLKVNKITLSLPQENKDT